MRKRTSLPIFDESCLDRIDIATPCSADWNQMKGDARVRHCGDCRLDVFNISEMTRAEAVQLIAGRAGRLCIRLYRRADGTLITADCWERLRAARRRGVWAFAAALILIGLAQLAMHVAAAGWLLGWVGHRRPAFQGAIAPVVNRPDITPTVPDPPREPLMGKPEMPHRILMGGPRRMPVPTPAKAKRERRPPPPTEALMGDIGPL